MLLLAFLAFFVNQASAQVTSYEQNFNEVVDTVLWKTLGGENGIVPTVQDGALKYTCTSNESFWFQAQIRFWALPVPVVLYLKNYPYISFRAMAEPGATYNGIELDSVTVAFTDNYGEYLSRKIPADGTWHELLFYISETLKETYVGHDQLWINPGLSVADGHFTNVFKGNVWIDDFKAGKAASPSLITELEDAKAQVSAVTIGTAPEEYSQVNVDAINAVIAEAEAIVAGKDLEEMETALVDLRYYLSLFRANWDYPVLTSFDEDFSGIIKDEIWNTLGGENGIVPTLEDDALKYTCTSNGSFWFQAQLRFGVAPRPVVFFLKNYPYVSFRAKAEPGATYDGYELDSVNVAFTDNYGEYLSGKIPADGTWHTLVFFLSETLKESYVGHDQMWVNPGLVVTDGHFSHEFVGTVWIDDFRVGKAGSPALLTLIDEAKAAIASAVVGTAPEQYNQAKVDALNSYIATAEAIAATHDLLTMEDAETDLKYYLSVFRANWDYPKLTSFEENFSGIYKEEIWNTLGGENGIVPSFEEGALKYSCTSNGSFWFQSQLRFWAQPIPIVFYFKENPYVGFRAKAEPGATYDGYELDSVNVAFTDNYGEYLSGKIPADGTWHELVFFLSETLKDGYVGHDQMWVNPGLVVTDGHFSHEFIGTVWIDDFKCGSAVILPDATNLEAVIDSSKSVVEAAVIGSANGEFTQEMADAANLAIAYAETQLGELTQEKVDNAIIRLRGAMSLFVANSTSIEELNALIVSSKEIVANAVIGGANGEYTQESVDAANTAIAAAETHLEGISQAIVDQAVADLEAAMSLFVPLSGVSVDQIEELQFGIYPNPVGNVMTIKNVAGYTDANIYSLKGQFIMKVSLNNEESVKIELSDIEPGVYVINLTSGKGIVTRQFVKK